MASRSSIGTGRVGVRARGLWPLKPVARLAVESVAEYITKSFAASAIQSMATLYTRREAQAEPGTPERRMLAQARVEATRLRGTYGGGGIGLPVVVAAGAAIPALLSGAQVLGQLPVARQSLLLTMLGVVFVLVLALSWSLLRGARIAHRRSQLIMGQPLAALWETVGNCGEPPGDDSVKVGAAAVMLPVVAWLVVPAAVAAVLFLV